MSEGVPHHPSEITGNNNSHAQPRPEDISPVVPTDTENVPVIFDSALLFNVLTQLQNNDLSADESDIYDAAFTEQPANTEVSSYLPVVYLSQAQKLRLKQFERILRLADKLQLKFEKGEQPILPLRNADGTPQTNEDGRRLGIVIPQNTTNILTSLADRMEAGLTGHPGTVQETRLIREKLQTERQAAVDAELASIKTIWDNSRDIL
jgi:hypothetical protein